MFVEEKVREALRLNLLNILLYLVRSNYAKLAEISPDLSIYAVGIINSQTVL